MMHGAFGEPGKERFALADSIGVPVEIAGYRDHGQDAHATKMPQEQRSGTR